MTADFSSENMETRKKKVLEEKNCQPIILQPAKISFKNEAKRKSFSGEIKLREFITNIPILEELLNEVFQSKRNITRSKLGKIKNKDKQQKQ